MAAERDDLRWANRVARWVRGGDVLDVGCGSNLQSVGHLAVGARTYTGLDPSLDLDSPKLKDSRGRWGKRTDAGITPRQMMKWMPRVSFSRQTLDQFVQTNAGQYDAVVMHNVTEHLMDLAGDLKRCAELLRPNGAIVFRHPNYYCWHGHHLRPRTIGEIDPDDAAQAAVIDWSHVRFDPEKHAWIGRTQNRVTLDQLRTTLEQHFEIERWEERESSREQGIDRLTPEILGQYPEYTRRDLATISVFVVARKRQP